MVSFLQAKSNPTLKDLDFTESGEKIAVGTEAKDRIMKVLEKDVQVNNFYFYSACYFDH